MWSESCHSLESSDRSPLCGHTSTRQSLRRSKSMRRFYSKIAVPAAALAVLLAGCTSGATPGSSAPSPSGSSGGAKGTLTLGATLDLQGWDPTKQPGYQSWAHEAVWDTLVKCDANGKATPDVADTFEVTDNNTTFKAHIREGQK